MRSSPSSRSDTPSSPAWLTASPYAHRGLHGPGRLENSRAAFEAAIAAGFGIELDVQMSRDGRAIVIHDASLGRLTEAEGRVVDKDWSDLRRIRLENSEETVPDLEEVLTLIGGRCALLIEVKAPRGKTSALCRDIEDRLRRYSGQAAIMSFNPEVGRWFAINAPHIVRGLVVTEKDKGRIRGRIERHLSLWRSGTDFLAYDIRDLPSPFAAATRARGLPLVTWTISNRRDEEAASAYADQMIHELPQKAAPTGR
ncbi:MAG: glycerophosphodiester phosphodiesterase [Sphingosinicella sp.]|nr:glycerophosphodiester phosphodiesterase [Sphingosinicella sp.]